MNAHKDGIELARMVDAFCAVEENRTGQNPAKFMHEWAKKMLREEESR